MAKKILLTEGGKYVDGSEPKVRKTFSVPDEAWKKTHFSSYSKAAASDDKSSRKQSTDKEKSSQDEESFLDKVKESGQKAAKWVSFKKSKDFLDEQTDDTFIEPIKDTAEEISDLNPVETTKNMIQGNAKEELVKTATEGVKNNPQAANAVAAAYMGKKFFNTLESARLAKEHAQEKVQETKQALEGKGEEAQEKLQKAVEQAKEKGQEAQEKLGEATGQLQENVQGGSNKSGKGGGKILRSLPEKGLSDLKGMEDIKGPSNIKTYSESRLRSYDEVKGVDDIKGISELKGLSNIKSYSDSKLKSYDDIKGISDIKGTENIKHYD
ncbi:hypothetical protein SAMN05421781_1820 [Marinococcus luteus]|uniref:Uncharacterized protein n=1 Tax=Marinococcus luteus TaxID=1122204 RepID=A0A1H2UQR5_9BACI|nr:hypothetical protein [Marinococcus luteus]SDW57919.1 hypothetical protein SAMN05421781_1820 [Marinococcus luteus]